MKQRKHRGRRPAWVMVTHDPAGGVDVQTGASVVMEVSIPWVDDVTGAPYDTGTTAWLSPSSRPAILHYYPAEAWPSPELSIEDERGGDPRP